MYGVFPVLRCREPVSQHGVFCDFFRSGVKKRNKFLRIFPFSIKYRRIRQRQTIFFVENRELFCYNEITNLLGRIEGMSMNHCKQTRGAVSVEVMQNEMAAMLRVCFEGSVEESDDKLRIVLPDGSAFDVFVRQA